MVNNSWDQFLENEFKQEYFIKLSDFLKQQYTNHVVYPKKEDVFSAFAYHGIKETKVVIVGQDPYHQPNQAHGLSFSVKPKVLLPPSLRNIFKELVDDMQIPWPSNGYLVPWAKQGVMLLNAVLTVEHNKPTSHQNKGWEQFSDHVIEVLNNQENPIVFILWGKNAQQKLPLITNTNHCVIKNVHPSPLSAHRGFFNSKPFSQTNDFLSKHNRKPIDWSL
jgi:uracil-DNA glycosylase